MVQCNYLCVHELGTNLYLSYSMIIHQQVLPTRMVDMKTLLWAILSLIGWYVRFVTYHVMRLDRANAVDTYTAKVRLIDLKHCSVDVPCVVLKILLHILIWRLIVKSSS